MATTSITTQLSDQEKTELTQTMSDFSKSLPDNIKTQNAAVVSAIRNNRSQTLRLYATHSWSGGFQSNPVGTINVGQSIQFLHFGPTPKGAVIYGEDQGGLNPAGYLLAWSLVNGTRRVYVKCGPLSEVNISGWESAALTSLNNSGSSSSAEDSRTSSRASASIRDDSGTFPLSIVGANFSSLTSLLS